MKPHVLIVSENLTYDHDPRVQAQAAALLDAGYDVSIAGPTAPGQEGLFERRDRIEIHRFRVAPPGGGFVGYLREYGLSALRLHLLLRRLARRRPVDVVIVCNPPDFLTSLVGPLRRRGASLLLDARELSPEMFEAKFGRRGPLFRILLAFERRAFRAADAVIITNASYADNVRLRGGVSDDRIFVVGNGPDLERIRDVEPRPELRRGRRHLVLWLGYMSTQEGMGRLIDVAEFLVAQRGREDVTVAVVGPGDVLDELREDAARRGLSDCVHLPGRVDDVTVRAYLATADVCLGVDPRNAMNDRAAMRKVLEYMAVGRAVVQFPLTEMQRICGPATEYAAENDAADMAERIGVLLDNPERRRALGAAARARVHGGLLWQQQIPSMLAAVERSREVSAGASGRSGAEAAGDQAARLA